MDSLPDELLLHILGFLDDGLDLLDAVPLVCKRWYRVTKDPRAWAGVVVYFSCCEEDSCQENDLDSHLDIFNAARIVLNAPFLGKVDFSGWWNTPALQCPFEERYVKSALRLSEAPAREVSFPAPDLLEGSGGLGYPSDVFEDMPTEDIKVLLDFLERSGDSLRVLELGQMLQWRKVETTLSQLAGLESLSLHLHSDFVPSGALRRAPPRLVRLEMATYRKNNGTVHLMAFLVGGAVGTLRQLRFNEACLPLAPAVVAEVRRCGELRGLSCDIADLAVVSSLPKLRWLKLNMFRHGGADDDSEDEGSGDPEILSSAAASLAQCGSLPSLRQLSVELQLYDGKLEDFRSELICLLEALGRAASSVTSLVLMTADLPVGGILSPMRALRTASLKPCPLEALAVLAGLPDLESLSGTVTFKEAEGDGPSQHAVAEFKRQRPEVKTELIVRQSW